MLAFVLIGLVIVVAITLSGPWICLAIGGCSGPGSLAARWYGYSSAGVLIDISFPLLGALVVYTLMIFLQFTIADADKRKIRRAFGHYVAPTLLEQIEKNRHSLKLGGELRELSVFFLDIRSFTTLSEGLIRRVSCRCSTCCSTSWAPRLLPSTVRSTSSSAISIMAFWNAGGCRPPSPCAPAYDPGHATPTCGAECARCLRTFGQHRPGQGNQHRHGHPPARRWWAISGLRRSSTIPASVTRSTSPRVSRAHPRPSAMISPFPTAPVRALAQLAFLDTAIRTQGQAGARAHPCLVGDATLAETAAFKALAAPRAQVLALPDHRRRRGRPHRPMRGAGA